jgi:hypothetical protein
MRPRQPSTVELAEREDWSNQLEKGRHEKSEQSVNPGVLCDTSVTPTLGDVSDPPGAD